MRHRVGQSHGYRDNPELLRNLRIEPPLMERSMLQEQSVTLYARITKNGRRYLRARQPQEAPDWIGDCLLPPILRQDGSLFLRRVAAC
jgi:hypothetical protein